MRVHGFFRTVSSRTRVNRGKKESQSLGFLPLQSTGRCSLSARAALGLLPGGKKGEFLHPRREGALERVEKGSVPGGTGNLAADSGGGTSSR
jgi:hypothetical protein